MTAPYISSMLNLTNSISENFTCACQNKLPSVPASFKQAAVVGAVALKDQHRLSSDYSEQSVVCSAFY
ncbi:hypothetical protein Q7A_03400 [Methylophaga nitratireducenticrescens]|nr:hypothetical protein Q7A_03400 [Methylophaga nitratireducenticrescens]AUZ83904.1 hypothetical protein CDW43_04665 [Methylophaga nitratireducenticrescens]